MNARLVSHLVGIVIPSRKYRVYTWRMDGQICYTLEGVELRRRMIFRDASATIGNTPLVDLGRLAKNLPGRVVAKLEMRNPCGSVKDRLGAALIEDAERRGLLRPGMTIVEPTGGNTGIGLAHVAAIKGYRLILTMPESMSRERVALLRHLGAEVVLTPGILMTGAVAQARKIFAEAPGTLMLDQFNNPANPDLHRRTTAVEIWDDAEGHVDAFVCAVGTGGTITGVGEALKQRKPDVRVVAIEPAGAALLSGGPAGTHQMPGIGVGFIPKVLNRGIIDEVIAVTDAEAFECARRLARSEGIVAGISSGYCLPIPASATFHLMPRCMPRSWSLRAQSRPIRRLSSCLPIPASATFRLTCSHKRVAFTCRCDAQTHTIDFSAVFPPLRGGLCRIAQFYSCSVWWSRSRRWRRRAGCWSAVKPDRWTVFFCS
jgi:cysteine synthase A